MAPTDTSNRRRVHGPHLALALGLLLVAGLLVGGAVTLPADKGYSILGPHVVPLAIAGLLGLVALLLAGQALRGGFHALDDTADAPTPARWQGAAWVSAGLLGVAALITHLGFVLSAALLFACAARGFGSRQPLRDLAIGVALTLPVFWLFTRGLGVALPPLVNAWI